jgi:hypothetical protein
MSAATRPADEGSGSSVESMGESDLVGSGATDVLIGSHVMCDGNSVLTVCASHQSNPPR